MKTTNLLTVLTVAMISFSACANNGTEGSDNSTESQEKAVIEQKKVQSVTFQGGTVVEVALFSITSGMESVVNDDYFPKVMPVAAEYGLKPLITFQVVKVDIGEAPAQMVGFFQWPSIEAKKEFDQDPRYLKLRNIRNKAMNFLYLGYLDVQKTQTVEFTTERIYDFFALWIDKSNAPKLDEYFQAVAPIAAQEYTFQLPHLEGNVIKEYGNYTPDAIGLGSWESLEAKDRFFRDERVSEKVPLREAATPYKDVLMLKPMI